jgi:hypothetical protein
MKRSKYNLLPYFIDDERSLAKRQAYVASCEKFFLTLKPASSPVDKRASLKYNKNRKV